MRSNVQKAFGEGPASFREALRTRINSPDALIQTLADLRDAAPADAGEAAARVRRVAVVVSRLAGRRLAMLQEALNAAARDTDPYRTLEHDVYRVR